MQPSSRQLVLQPGHQVVYNWLYNQVDNWVYNQFVVDNWFYNQVTR